MNLDQAWRQILTAYMLPLGREFAVERWKWALPGEIFSGEVCFQSPGKRLNDGCSIFV